MNNKNIQEDSEIYDLWYPKNLTIPTRSYLYNLEPVKIGTSDCESLISYTTRLSEAHSISIQTLFVKIIASSNTNNSEKTTQNKLIKVLNRGATLNSDGMLAKNLALSLTNLTTKENLRYLTLLSYKNLFSSKNLFKHSKSWCPYCYKQLKESNQIIYEPLLWIFADANICPKHYQPLHNVCPSCNSTIPWLTGNLRIGYCSSCESWLGNIPESRQKKIANQSEIDFSQNLWMTKVLGEFIAFIPQAKYLIDMGNISKALKQTIDITHESNIAAFARSFGLPKNTVWMWCNGKSKPELGVILKICYCLDISLVDFISLKQMAMKSVQIHPQRLSTPMDSKRRSPKLFDREKVQIYLQHILNDSETPPMNLPEISEALGFHTRTISSHFPNLCKAITSKYRTYRKLKTKERIKNCCQEIEKIVSDLHQSGQYPTEASISKLLSHPGHLRYKKVRDALENAIANVNIQA